LASREVLLLSLHFFHDSDNFFLFITQVKEFLHSQACEAVSFVSRVLFLPKAKVIGRIIFMGNIPNF